MLRRASWRRPIGLLAFAARLTQAARMGFPAEKRRRATLADLETVPPNRNGELINGTLYIFSRPAPPHAHAASVLGMEIGGPFQRGRGGPGGWRILDEPDLLLGPPDDEDDIIPDLAGWRIERMPVLPPTAKFTLVPDWVCEILSPGTISIDRGEKMPAYARHGVRHVWLLDPLARTLEVFMLEAGRWVLLNVHHGDARVRAEPFEAIELELAALWGEVELRPEGGETREPTVKAGRKTSAAAKKTPRKSRPRGGTK